MRQPRRILIAGAGAELRSLLAHLGDSLPDVVVEEAASAEPRALNGKALSSDALVVEVDLRSAVSTDSFVRLTGELGGGKVIAAAHHAQPEDVRRLFRAGAADVLTAPFTTQALKSALADVMRIQGQERVGGRVVTIMKAVGGAGATTTALNLAALFAQSDRKRQMTGRSAAVLDLDIQFGDAALALNLEPRSSLVDVLRAHDRFDGRFLQGAMTDHASGLRLLAAPPAVIPLDALSPDLASEIVIRSTELHEYTFVDLPCVWTDWTLQILRRSSRIVLIAPATVQGAVGARRTLDALAEECVETPTLFVLNRVAGMVEAFEKPSQISHSLNRAVDAVLSLDANATRAFDRGALFVDAFPKARLTRDLRTLADKIGQKPADARPVTAEHTGAAA
jgi:pilus assembly protein CpaE